jgi:hypothetical protein
MPGRDDFAIIRARLLADERAHKAAALYVERGLAVEATALATIVGHVACFAVWATRETDKGILPGDGVAAASVALMVPPSTARLVVDALREAQLLRGLDVGTYLVGFRDCYSALFNKRKADRHRLAQARRSKRLASKKGRRDQDATSSRRRAGVAPGSRTTAAAAAAAAVPLPSDPPMPPQGGAEGGGGSASPSENGHGAAAAPAPVDRAVFEALWARVTSGKSPFTGQATYKDGRYTFHPNNKPGTRASAIRESLAGQTPDVDGLVAFVQEFSTKGAALKETLDIQRSFAMGRNARGGGRRR